MPTLLLTAAAADDEGGTEAAAPISSDSEDDDDSSNTLAIVALVVGGLGVILGGLALVRSRSTAPARQRPRSRSGRQRGADFWR